MALPSGTQVGPYEILAPLGADGMGEDRRDVWKELTTSDPAGVWRIHPVVVTGDGGSYAYSYSSAVGDLDLVEGAR